MDVSTVRNEEGVWATLAKRQQPHTSIGNHNDAHHRRNRNRGLEGPGSYLIGRPRLAATRRVSPRQHRCRGRVRFFSFETLRCPLSARLGLLGEGAEGEGKGEEGGVCLSVSQTDR